MSAGGESALPDHTPVIAGRPEGVKWAAARRIPELPDIPLVQLFHRIPMNTTYWTGWPTAENAYVNGAFWHLTYAMVLWHLQPTQ